MTNKIKIKEMIITCESCGNVKHFQVNSEEDCNRIFQNFQCENNCVRNLYSFITVGSLERDSYSIPKKMNIQLAIAK